MGSSPFGVYAAVIAAIAALGILAAWLVTQVVPAFPSSESLDTAALMVLGAIFGSGATGLVLANGAGRQATLANTRLDAIGAPAGHAAEELVSHGATTAPTGGTTSPPPATLVDPDA